MLLTGQELLCLKKSSEWNIVNRLRVALLFWNHMSEGTYNVADWAKVAMALEIMSVKALIMLLTE